uniref:Uncharacterized protein n=1 Tax=Anguilla anguilla TaxID=7936 RepID=A0A0E9S2M1_ANGAN
MCSLNHMTPCASFL